MENLRLLLVEDERHWQKILKEKLSQALQNIDCRKYIIKVVNTFDEAYTILQESDWHLLVTDIGLIDSPTAHGQKLGIHLVEMAHSKQIPTIVVSGTPVISTQDVRDILIKYQPTDYFSKGKFDNQEFIIVVVKFLQQQLLSSPNNDKSLKEDSYIKILFLASDPGDAYPLRLGKEFRDIKEKLLLSKNRDKFKLEQHMSVRVDDLTQAILDFQPQILHFSGHGTNMGELCFEDILGNMQRIQPENLADLFSLLNEHINCVILNACHSIIQAKAITNHVPFVIGMSTEISDQAATKFAVGFYKALGANFSIKNAYKFSCVEMKLHGLHENFIPVLYQQTST